MEHVSTLCAASTVGVAATGFALGRVDRPSKPYASQRKTRSLQFHSAPVTDVPNPTCSDARPRSSRLSAVVEATFRSKPVSVENNGPRNDIPEECLPDIPNSQKELPPFKMSGLRRFRRRGYTNPIPKSVEERPTAMHSRRPSSSWLRRLSISSFNPESNNPSGPTPTPSTFGSSTNSCTARPSSQRRSPNKLVKRSSSQHSILHPLLSRTTPSTSSTSAPLQRPATSYQRTGPPSRIEWTPDGTPEPEKKHIWRPYLTSTSAGSVEKLVRPLSAAGDARNHGLRLVFPPDVDTVPALLLASSVTKSEIEGAVEARRRFTTAPANCNQFRDPFKHADTTTQPSERPSRPETAPSVSPDTLPETVPRTISGTAPDTVLPEMKISQVPVYLSETGSTASVSGVPDARNIRNFSSGSLRRVKGRTFSTNLTLPDLANLEGANLRSSFSHGRRNATDPGTFRRPLSASSPVSLVAETSELRKSLMSLSLPRASSDMSHLRDLTRRSSTSDAVPLSPSSEAASYRLTDSNSYLPFRQRMKRLSTATSDPASTVISSDDTHTFTSGGEDETDFMSETAFDSVRTCATASSYSRPRGPRIDKVFDDENVPCRLLKERLASLEELLPRGSFSADDGVNDDENGRADKAEMMTGQGYPAAREPETVSVTRSVSLTSNLSDARSSVGPLPGEANGLFSIASQSASPSAIGKDAYNDSRDLFCTTRTQDSIVASGASSLRHKQSRTNIFDWSEQPKTDRGETAGSDARPNTVHGKQGGDVRGSRPPVRRAPNALHLRSQSVPSRDSAMNEPFQTSTKFGTWGLGSKGVSEDWDSDFEFDDGEENAPSDYGKPNKKVVGQRGMVVPQAIMERQASLHGQFGQVQELTMLVEELKRLRHQAGLLHVAHGSSSELWKEADSIINLATVDDDDDNSRSPPRSPSSLTFSFDDSDEDSRNNVDDPSKQGSEEPWRKSPSEQTNPSRSVSPSQSFEKGECTATKPMSVLDLIYQRRTTTPDPLRLDTSISVPQKLPFDTQSLQNLVVRAGVVTRALKEVIRKAEGVTTVPDNTILQPAPAFSRIFEQPPGAFF